MNRINLLFACDTRYAMPLTVCITSVFANEISKEVHAYVLYSSLSEDQKEKLIQLAEEYQQHIHLIHVDEHYFDTAPTLRWTKETYYRLLISELLPADLDMVLYLDCDIIANKSIDALYRSELGENDLAACPIAQENPGTHRARLGLDPSGNYFQAGVILFDVARCRSKLSYQKVSAVITGLDNRLMIVDQDVLNVMFDGSIKPISQAYNDTEMKRPEESFIFHYATGKPWNRLYAGSSEEIWYKYLVLSPYKQLYAERYGTLGYKILRSWPAKQLFRHYILLTPLINKIATTLFPQNLYHTLRNYYRTHIK